MRNCEFQEMEKLPSTVLVSLLDSKTEFQREKKHKILTVTRAACVK